MSRTLAAALGMLDLGLASDWRRLGEGVGVESARAETMDRFAILPAQADGRPGPFLIELVI